MKHRADDFIHNSKSGVTSAGNCRNSGPFCGRTKLIHLPSSKIPFLRLCSAKASPKCHGLFSLVRGTRKRTGCQRVAMRRCRGTPELTRDQDAGQGQLLPGGVPRRNRVRISRSKVCVCQPCVPGVEFVPERASQEFFCYWRALLVRRVPSLFLYCVSSVALRLCQSRSVAFSVGNDPRSKRSLALLFTIQASGSLFVPRRFERLAQSGSGLRLVVSRCCVEREESQWASLYDVVGVVLQSVRPANCETANERQMPAE